MKIEIKTTIWNKRKEEIVRIFSKLNTVFMIGFLANLGYIVFATSNWFMFGFNLLYILVCIIVLRSKQKYDSEVLNGTGETNKVIIKET